MKGYGKYITGVLLIHNASIDPSVSRVNQGFGFNVENIMNVLRCSDNKVTIMYEGEIFPTQFLSLPIFAPRLNDMSGIVYAWC